LLGLWTFSYYEVTTRFECKQVITAFFLAIMQRVMVRGKNHAEANISQSLHIV